MTTNAEVILSLFNLDHSYFFNSKSYYLVDTNNKPYGKIKYDNGKLRLIFSSDHHEFI